MYRRGNIRNAYKILIGTCVANFLPSHMSMSNSGCDFEFLLVEATSCNVVQLGSAVSAFCLNCYLHFENP